ncbi:MAG: T9SS type A sorting domain-containing protein [Bacteroidetes bacterium]|nr:T9SS type A sorting domain-containing protein [Bacteroidota bacterium]
MKAFVRVLFIFIFLNCANGLAQEIEWQRTIGGSDLDMLSSIKPTADGGVICGGGSLSGVSGDKTEACRGLMDYWVVKIDSYNNIEWEKTIGGSSWEAISDIQQTFDGGYICVGYTDSNISGDKTENGLGSQDFWVLKLSNVGNIEWQNTIGGSGLDLACNILQAADGGYVISGHSSSGISGDKTSPCWGGDDFWIVKIDSLGQVIWDKTIGGNGGDLLFSMILTPDGGIVCGGTSGSDISGNKTIGSAGGLDFWIVKLDSSGNILWQNVIGGNDVDMMRSIQLTSDNGFICSGYSKSGISGNKTDDNFGYEDIWIVKVDSVGMLQWQVNLGGESSEDCNSIVQTLNGEYIVGGFSSSNISGNKVESRIGQFDYWIIKLDSFGNIIWQNTIGGVEEERIYELFQTTDGGLLAGGYSSSGISFDKTSSSKGSSDFWLVKLTDNYNLLKGKVYADLNNDGMQNSIDPGISSAKIVEYNTGRIGFSGNTGKYYVSVLDSGQFQISPTTNYPYFIPNPNMHSASFAGINQLDSLNDFAFQPAGIYDDLCMTITPLGQFRPGFNGSYMLNYENVGTTSQSPTIVFRIFPSTSFFNSSLAPSIIYPDSVVWNLPALAPFQTGQILVTINLSPTIPIGTILNSYAQIFPIANDVNPSCNNATWEVTVRGSYDPNDILVDQDTLYSYVFPNPPYLDYIIRFQNVGNDTAFTVKILNALDTMKLDLNSLEFVAASHPMEMRFIYHERNMEFMFNNILLPDSNVNEPASHGFVRYKIKTKSNLQVGDSIKNFAAIYFDFNEPVITNTAKTDIVLFTGLAEQISTSELFVYPNPSSQEINIQVSNTQGKRISLDVYNLFGQKIKSLFDGKIMSSELKQQFDISSLHQGVYLLQYNVDGVTKSRKIIKL